MNNYNPVSYVYADMILYSKINPATNQVWCLEDVPEKYREEVIQILEN